MREAADGTIAVGRAAHLRRDVARRARCTEMTEIAERLDESGLVDFLDLDVGTYHSFDVMIVAMGARRQLGGRAHPADRAGHPLRAAPLVPRSVP